MTRLSGKTVVVTGAASGIGKAGALCCGKEGAQVAILDRDGVGAQETKAEVERSGGKAYAYEVDVTKEEQIQAAIADVVAKNDGVDALIHSAGILEGAYVSIDEFEDTDWDRVIDVNLKGSYLAVKHVVPAMEGRGGVILLVSSSAGVRGGSSSVAYGASKGGVHGLSLVLAGQLASRQIRVHAVCPGSLDTPLKLKVVQRDAELSGRSFEELRSGLGDPDGVGKVLAFLASGEADYVRGTIFTR